MNVLIYDDEGVSKLGVWRLKHELGISLSDRYSIQSVTAKMLSDEPWELCTSMLVIGGGRDKPYMNSLSNKAISKIRNFVLKSNGKFLGVCAGAYFSTTTIEFCKNDPFLEIIENRPLRFINGNAVGPVTPNEQKFEYNSENGAHLIDIIDADSGQTCKVYNNGGCRFDLHNEQGDLKVLSTFLNGDVACIRRTYPNGGRVVLTGQHPEFAMHLEVCKRLTQVNENIEILEEKRRQYFKSLLINLDLKLNDDSNFNSKTLLPLILTHKIIDNPNLLNLFDSFHSLQNCDIAFHNFENFHSNYQSKIQAPLNPDMDLSKVTKDVHVAFNRYQITKLITPKFDINNFFNMLLTTYVGQYLLYAEATTSTQTILDSNLNLLKILPDGFLTLASHQLVGKGRGKNSWVSPSGCLQFSLVLKLDGSKYNNVIFVQYFISLMVVKALKKFNQNLNVKLKWPNDIYAIDNEGNFKKIGGVLINSHYINNNFNLIIGVGLNVKNSNPSTCVNDLIPHLNLSMEQCLALIMSEIEENWSSFKVNGFNNFFDEYYDSWLHSDQKIKIEESGEIVRIACLSPSFGYLRTYRDPNENYSTGGNLYDPIDLQPDGNSFDMLKGLIKVKRNI